MTLDVERSVREFLQEVVSVPGADVIGGDESLLDSGFLDSAGIFQLVAFLEERFRLSIADEDVVPENFDTIDAVVALVTTKVGTRGGGGDESE